MYGTTAGGYFFDTGGAYARVGYGSYGVYGGGSTYGVYGTGTSYGVYGNVSSGSAGVYGYNSSSSAGISGVYGRATTSTEGSSWTYSGSYHGVMGQAYYGDSYHAGVYGYTWDDNSSYPYAGVFGAIGSDASAWGALGYDTGALEYSGYFEGGTYMHGNWAAGTPSLSVYARNDNWAVWAEEESGYTGGGGAFGAPSGFYGLVCTGGTKSCAIMTSDGVTGMFSMESPEVWFEDIGGGELINGKAHIELDDLFLETVTIDNDHPMRVFVQPNGMCNGLVVVKGQTGFDVLEIGGGTSNIEFDYRILAKRKYCENDRMTVWPNPHHEFNEEEQADIDKVQETMVIMNVGTGVLPETPIDNADRDLKKLELEKEDVSPAE